MLGEIVVAAIDRRDHFAAVAERLLQRATGADRAVFDLRTDVGFVFAADLGEELIQIMDDTDLLLMATFPLLFNVKIRNPKRRKKPRGRNKLLIPFSP